LQVPKLSDIQLALFRLTTPDRSEARKRRRQREEPGRKRAEGYVERCLAQKAKADEKFLVGLHAAIVGGQPVGYRTGPVVVRWHGVVVYRPPAAEELPSAMRGFFDLAGSGVEGAGSACLYLLKVHPFVRANGRTARWAATYLLMVDGFSPRRGRSLESFVDSSVDEYYGALALSTDDSPGPWLEYFSQAVGFAFKQR
jgi:Fic family protein